MRLLGKIRVQLVAIVLICYLLPGWCWASMWTG